MCAPSYEVHHESRRLWLWVCLGALKRGGAIRKPEGIRSPPAITLLLCGLARDVVRLQRVGGVPVDPAVAHGAW